MIMMSLAHLHQNGIYYALVFHSGGSSILFWSGEVPPIKKKSSDCIFSHEIFWQLFLIVRVLEKVELMLELAPACTGLY